MLQKIKNKIYINKANKLFDESLANGQITEFEPSFYDEMNKFYINGLPIGFRIKYLKPINPPGDCFRRSRYMFYCFKDAYLVRGSNRMINALYGEDDRHGWIEIGDYVYDPTYVLRFEKELYYQLFEPSEVIRMSHNNYFCNEENKEEYNIIMNTKAEDFMPGGIRENEAKTMIPIMKDIISISNNYEMEKDLEDFTNLINYDNNIKKR